MVQNLLVILLASSLTVSLIFHSPAKAATSPTSPVQDIRNKLLSISNATNETSGSEPIIFVVFKIENNTLENMTRGDLEKIKSNLSSTAAEYINGTLDTLYNATLSNQEVKPAIYSSLWDNIWRILGLFF